MLTAMFGYRIVMISGVLQVQHVDTGVTHRYNPKVGKQARIPDWKYKYFVQWLALSNTSRKAIFRGTYGNKQIVMEKMQSMYTETVSVTNIGAGVVTAPNPSWYDLAPLPPQQACVPVQAKSPIKKGKKMAYYEDDCDCCSSAPLSDEFKKRRYLGDRIYTIRETKVSSLRKQFNLDQDYPNTVQELIDRIKAGTFTVKKEDLNRELWVGHLATSYIDWRDPAKPADQPGFDEAVEALSAATTATNDQVQVGDITDALKAIQAFEKWTYTT